LFEFHGWFGLAETTEESDVGGLETAVDDIRRLIETLNWQTARAEVYELNGEYFLGMHGLVKRRLRHEAIELETIIDEVITKLPGSYGLIYERSDDGPQPPGPGAFLVRVLARGQLVDRLDPFLSPTRRTIED
jgi:hypothetical protein